jgi:O-antigen ligase
LSKPAFRKKKHKGVVFIVQALRSCYALFAGKKEISQADINRAAVFLFTVSLFLPFYCSLVTVSCIAFMTMVKYRIRTKAFQAPFTKLIFTFLVGSFFVAAAYNNYRGMAYSILIYAIVVCGLYFRSIMTRELYNMALDTACVASVFCVGIAFIQKIITYPLFHTYRPVSTFVNANYFGMMIEFIVIIALYRIFTNPKRTMQYAMVIALNLAGLYLTGSFSSAFGMACAVLVLLVYKRQSKVAKAAFLVMIAAGIAFFAFPQLLPRSVSEIQRTINQRMSIWNAAWRAFKSTPIFGRGATAYHIIWEQYGGYKTYHCHSLVLDTLLNFGVVGAAAVCIYIGSYVRLLVQRYRHHICRDLDMLVVAIFLSVLVHGLTDVTIVWIQTGAFFFLIISSLGIDSVYQNQQEYLAHLVSTLEDRTAQAAYLKN